ncbi:MAG: hypothetical protein WA584_22550 [Pyrinomonadaceae bacterium]
MTAEATAEAQLGEIANALEAIRFRLLGVQASLPASPLERDPLRDEDEMDTASQLRALVGCVLEDRIEPALRELRRAGA